MKLDPHLKKDLMWIQRTHIVNAPTHNALRT